MYEDIYHKVSRV